MVLRCIHSLEPHIPPSKRRLLGSKHRLPTAYLVSAAFLGVCCGKLGVVSADFWPHLLFCKPKKPMETGKMAKTVRFWMLPHYQLYFWPLWLGLPGPMCNFDFWGKNRSVSAASPRLPTRI